MFQFMRSFAGLQTTGDGIDTDFEPRPRPGWELPDARETSGKRTLSGSTPGSNISR